MVRDSDASQGQTANRLVRSRGGLEMPALGMGAWQIGMDAAKRKDEIAALQLGLDLGMTLIDTAEIYGDGGSEEVVGEAIAGRRDEVVVVTKVHPTTADRTIERGEASLRRLNIDCIDLYLLHDKPIHPLEATLEALDRLKQDGKILHYGVSNFDTDLMRECEALSLGPNVESNQLRYSLGHRGLEHELLGWCEQHQISIMAYSPVDEGVLSVKPELEAVAARHGVSPFCIAIAWTIRHPMLVSIPKAANPDHLRENARAMDLKFTEEDLAALDRAYPRPPPGHFDVWQPA